jgi:hypothetical protein
MKIPGPYEVFVHPTCTITPAVKAIAARYDCSVTVSANVPPDKIVIINTADLLDIPSIRPPGATP